MCVEAPLRSRKWCFHAHSSARHAHFPTADRQFAPSGVPDGQVRVHGDLEGAQPRPCRDHRPDPRTSPLASLATSGQGGLPRPLRRRGLRGGREPGHQDRGASVSSLPARRDLGMGQSLVAGRCVLRRVGAGGWLPCGRVTASGPSARCAAAAFRLGGLRPTSRPGSGGGHPAARDQVHNAGASSARRSSTADSVQRRSPARSGGGHRHGGACAAHHASSGAAIHGWAAPGARQDVAAARGRTGR